MLSSSIWKVESSPPWLLKQGRVRHLGSAPSREKLRRRRRTLRALARFDLAIIQQRVDHTLAVIAARLWYVI
eukprot:COSAG02_NODE_1402_length_12818_cov_18.233352_9_plen_72_part_00